MDELNAHEQLNKRTKGQSMASSLRKQNLRRLQNKARRRERGKAIAHELRLCADDLPEGITFVSVKPAQTIPRPAA